MHMNHFSVNIRLFLLVGLLSLVSIIVGLTGLKGMSDSVNGLRTVYEDRVVPLRDLKVIADLYAVNIVDMTHKVRNSNIEWEEARKNLKDAREGTHGPCQHQRPCTKTGCQYKRYCRYCEFFRQNS